MGDSDNPRLEHLRNEYLKKLADLEAERTALKEMERCKRASDFRQHVYLSSWADRGGRVALDTIDRYRRNVKIGAVFAVAAVTGQYFNPVLVAWISANCAAAAAAPAVAAALAFVAKIPISSAAQKLLSVTGEYKGTTIVGVLFEKSFDEHMRFLIEDLRRTGGVSSYAHEIRFDLMVGGSSGEYDVIAKWDRWAVKKVREDVGGTSNEQFTAKTKILYDLWSEVWDSTTPAIVQLNKGVWRVEDEVRDAKRRLDEASKGVPAQGW
jgi:hypothetical protein